MSKRTSDKQGMVTRIPSVRKEDTKQLVVSAVEGAPDDAFVGSYWDGKEDPKGFTSLAVLEPTYKPGTLYTLTVQNNTLSQCVEAMEVNIDGTGHSIDLIEGAVENEAEKAMLEDFFREPYPARSMIAIRRAMRRDLEATGGGYLEVIRTAADDIVMLQQLSTMDIRLVRYDAPVAVQRTVKRSGKDVTLTMQARERRFVQNINGAKTYFKQFGASRDLDRLTGMWAAEGTRLPAEKRATELLYFMGNSEPKTPYGTPRWINQMPSILGSRKAEEHNLEFFDSGGLPPVLIIVQGGTMGDQVRETLVNHLSGKGASHRAAVVEAVSTSGSLDSAGSVQVKVERFGGEKQKDAMFQMYDENTGDHVRCAFRLPVLFIGKASDMSFATAYASYLVAEAQVFSPEREEFDAVINATIVRGLGATSYRYRSLPLSMVDVANQLKALEMVDGKYVDGEDIILKLNELLGLGLTYKKQEQLIPPSLPGTGETGKIGQGGELDLDVNPSDKKGVGTSVAKSDLSILADKWIDVTGLAGSVTAYTGDEVDTVMKSVETLHATELRAFNQIVAEKMLGQGTPEGVDELCGCANHLTE